MFRIGIILYAVSLPFQRMSGVDLPYVTCVLGILVAVYTIAGGLQAVIYTDVLQGLALIAGGLICMPIILQHLPGGFSQIFTEAYADGKLSVGSTGLNLDEKTVWVIILVYQFQFLQLVCTDQTMVQRYLAIKTDKEARRGFLLGTALTIPVWLYFSFIGTALYVFYKNFSTPALNNAEPEVVFPYFILTQVPAGVAGLRDRGPSGCRHVDARLQYQRLCRDRDDRFLPPLPTLRARRKILSSGGALVLATVSPDPDRRGVGDSLHANRDSDGHPDRGLPGSERGSVESLCLGIHDCPCR